MPAKNKAKIITEQSLATMKQIKMLAAAAASGDVLFSSVTDSNGNSINKQWLLQKLVFLSEGAAKSSDQLSALNSIGKIIGAFTDTDKGKGAERRAYLALMEELLKGQSPEKVKSEVIDEPRQKLPVPSETGD